MLSSAEHLRGAELEEMNELETWRCCDMRELRLNCAVGKGMCGARGEHDVRNLIRLRDRGQR